MNTAPPDLLYYKKAKVEVQKNPERERQLSKIIHTLRVDAGPEG
jgi:hypothetical protein